MDVGSQITFVFINNALMQVTSCSPTFAFYSNRQRHILTELELSVLQSSLTWPKNTALFSQNLSVVAICAESSANDDAENMSRPQERACTVALSKLKRPAESKSAD